MCLHQGAAGRLSFNPPDCILRPRSGNDQGSFDEIPLEQALNEIAARMQACIDKDGPKPVAIHKGTQGFPRAMARAMARG